MEVVVGIDEVGRGCLAGPLVASAVILSSSIPHLKDSKKLSARQRNILAEQIQLHAVAIGIGWVSPQDVDKFGITQSVAIAMKKSLDQITVDFTTIIMDGNYNFLKNDARVVTVVKADDTVACVSAASIIAKVARDSYMNTISSEFPEYGFDRHKGYGTAYHMNAIKNYGITPHHRTSFKPVQSVL